MTTYRNTARDWTQFCYRWQIFHQMKCWKVCSNWEHVSMTIFFFFKNLLELYDMEIHHTTRSPTVKNWRQWWNGTKIRNFDCETLTSGTGENWTRIRGKSWRRKRYLLPEERKRAVFARRPLQFPPRNPRCAQKPEHTHTAATLSGPSMSRGRSVSEENRGKSNHGPIARQPCRLFEGYLHANVLWILASARVPILKKKKRVVCQETRVWFFTSRLMRRTKQKAGKRPISQKEEKVKTTALWLWKASHNWVVHHRMHSFARGTKEFGETRCRKSWTQFEKFDSLSPRYDKRAGSERTIVG